MIPSPEPRASARLPWASLSLETGTHEAPLDCFMMASRFFMMDRRFMNDEGLPPAQRALEACQVTPNNPGKFRCSPEALGAG